MDYESGELMELVEEVPLKELGNAKVVDEGKPEVGSRDKGKAYCKERSVIRREEDVDGRASVTKDEQRVLQGG